MIAVGVVVFLLCVACCQVVYLLSSTKRNNTRVMVAIDRRIS